MKKQGITAILTLVLVTLTTACEQHTETKPGHYDLAVFSISDTKASQWLKTKTLPIRAHNFDVETGNYPVLALEPVAADAPKALLLKQVSKLSRLERDDTTVEENADLYYLETDKAIHWSNKVSGATSFTDRKQTGTGKSEIKDHRQAVRIALDHISRLELLRTEDEEQLDIISVAQVMNALIEDGEDEPFDTFASDYLVVFGRRIQGTPVIGSYLQLRIGPEGDLLGLQRNWRQISPHNTKQQIKVDAARLDELTRNHFQKAGLTGKDSDLETIEIVNRVCGYLEGPASYRQDFLEVGCVVNYRRRGDELVAAMPVRLGNFAHPLLGHTPKSDQQAPLEKPVKPPESAGKQDEAGADEPL